MGAAAYWDYRYKRIPDIFTAFSWILVVLYSFLFPSTEPLLMAGASFAILFFINASLAQLKTPLLAWGDILLCPVYVAYSVFIANAPGELTLLLLLPLVFLFWYVFITGKKEKVALAPFLFISAISGLLL